MEGPGASHLTMSERPFISVCIPAYKRIEFLARLLDSISLQSYRDFEVIVSDDSPGNEVEQLCRQYARHFLLVYHKNPSALGTPENWNEAIRRASGQWIKLMHDDDWFGNADALLKFAAAAQKETKAMLFAAYYDVSLSDSKEKRVILPAFRFRMLKKEPVSLLSRNIIGPPSVVMHRNNGLHQYDPRLKWLVDVDMYVRRLQTETPVYIPEPLIKVGIGDEQVTASVHGAPEVEVPEHFYFLQKTGIKPLRNLLVYDYWWRFIRNFQLFSGSAIRQYGYEGPVHPIILHMMAWEKRIPVFILKTGMLSKALMTLHFLLYRKKIAAS